MQARHRVRIKICCISSVKEMRLAVELGADAVGLVSRMHSGPGVISEAKISEIAALCPAAVSSFLLTSEQSVEKIIKQQRRCGVDTLQLCDRLALDAYAELRRELPGISLVQVVHVQGPEAIEEARSVAAFVDAILLDSGRPDSKEKQLGGTGRTHDWSLSKQIRQALDVPIFLAGGLRADNVIDALHGVRPYAVDVCSGVRSNGRLDKEKLAEFVQNLSEI